MSPRRATGVGRFSVELEVANYGDRALTQRVVPRDPRGAIYEIE